MPTVPLADWLARLETYSPHEIDLGLDRVRAVLDKLDLSFPQTVLHVAGTNGKGSSVALAESLLLTTGASVGSYTSPHINDYNERIRIDGDAVTDSSIVEAFERVDACRGDTPLTYFEFGTLAALVVFETVDIAILEIGMGGRLDAVNAVEPTAGLITNVALDHCDWLGNDIETIAREKAGIMRARKPVVFATSECPQTVLDAAAELGADLILCGRDYTWNGDGETGWWWQGRKHKLEALPFPAIGTGAQMSNAAGVLSLLEAAGFDDLLDAGRVSSALSTLQLAGRMQSIRTDRHWLLDVAHNPAAAHELAFSLSTESWPDRNVAIVGMLDDKDVEGVIGELRFAVDRFIAVAADNPRAIDVESLARRVANASGKACLEAESLDHALAHARTLTTDEDLIVVTGSFYVVGPALEALGIYSPR